MNQRMYMRLSNRLKRMGYLNPGKATHLWVKKTRYSKAYVWVNAFSNDVTIRRVSNA